MNIMEMMKKAQSLQGDMQKAKDEIDAQTFQGDAGAGAVVATMSGAGKLQNIEIAPAVFQSDDTEIVQDLIVAAVNHATEARRAYRREKMQSLTAGLPIPSGLMGQL